MDDRVHRLPVRVYHEDTDAMGIVHHATYLRFAERGRIEYLRTCSLDHRNLREAADGNFVVRSMTVDFHAAAWLDDEPTVETRLRDVSGASATMEQVVRRSGTTQVTRDVRLAFHTSARRPSRIPAAARRAFLDRA